MTTFCNPTSKFGITGPFEADSLESLLHTLRESSFAMWSDVAWYVADTAETKDEFAKRSIAEMESDFLTGMHAV
jgi:hypothetical protein